MTLRTFATFAGAVLAAAFSAASPPAAAALFDRGGGMVYDDQSNLTWLRHWNLAAGTAYDDGPSATDGKMSWASALAWAADLTWGGHDDWRLPLSDTCLGFNCRNSEIGALWYGALGNGGGRPPVNLQPFTDVRPSTYWTGSTYLPGPDHALYFNAGAGGQSIFPKTQHSHAVAVRVGDVSPVPEPGSAALWLAGLAAGAVVVRRRAGPR